MDVTTLAAQITQVQTQLAALDVAINAVLDPTNKAYTLDTGQSNQSYTRMNITDLLSAQSSLQNRLCTLQARQTGGGILVSIPAW